ncbi:hypothetical protein OC861_003368 [Tilletia horrida]|nr:hypothetical protein OC861_003368 [Tilletia horrida]
MGRHSKHNSSGTHFTYGERQMLKGVWGANSARLTSQSVRAFDMCSLCLDTARNPVVCTEGHLFCKECILDSLLQQSKDITAQKRYLAQLDVEEEAAQERAKEQARSRILRQFEVEQSGVRRNEGAAPTASSKSGRVIEGERDRIQSAEARRKEQREEEVKAREQEATLTLKRKAPEDGGDDAEGGSLVGSTLAHLPDLIALKLRQAEESALNDIKAEQRDARRSKLPAFWLPSLTPSEVEGRPKDIKLHTLCRTGNARGHKLKMKNLVDVKFTRIGDDKGGDDSAESERSAKNSRNTICPSCKKGIGNHTNLFVLRGCGDVLCSKCIDTIIKPSFAAKDKTVPPCPACDTPLSSAKSLDDAVLPLDREGTGFAAGGQAEAKRQGIAFQG